MKVRPGNSLKNTKSRYIYRFIIDVIVFSSNIKNDTTVDAKEIIINREINRYM